jgi:DNA helicase-2/ATP-dependent DNA helicase PcrA
MTSEHVSHLVAVVDAIVNTTENFVEVTASPGSGKTHTLVQRVHHLLSVGVPASQILVLSFSKSSVGVLRRRLDSFPDTESSALKNVTVATAHAFALSLILKKLVVLSDIKALRLVTSAIKSTIADCTSKKLWPSVKPKTKASCLGQLQDLLKQPQQLKAVLSFFSVVSASRKLLPEVLAMSRFTSLLGHLKVLRAISRRFAAVKGKQCVIDYGDMLQLAIKAIRKDPQAVPFTHILVDEYQDCSAAQTHLLAELALAEAPYSTSASKRGPGLGMGLGRNIMVFGDANQAIFGFAGATYTPLSSVLPGVRYLALPMSRRLTAQTAALASAVSCSQSESESGPGTNRGLGLSKFQGAAIQTSKSGEMPVLVRDRSLRFQTKHIVADIEKLISEGEEPAKIVVLARTKALLQPVEQLLLANQLPTARAGSTRDRKHVQRVLKLLRLVERRERQAKEATVTKRFHIETDDLIKTMSSAIEMPVTDSRWKSEALKLANACKLPSLEGRYKLCSLAYLRLMGGDKAAANAEVQTEINRWQAFSRGYQGAKSMMMAVKSMPKLQAVTTGTIHSAKGGEWDHVFIVGVTDGLLPLHYSWGDSASITEERNLLYVAITRAIKTVRMYHSPSANSKTGQKFKKLSRG